MLVRIVAGVCAWAGAGAFGQEVRRELVAPEDDDELIAVSGRVLVEDENGAELSEESGFVDVRVWTYDGRFWSGSSSLVPLVDGEFRLEAPLESELEFECFRLSGTLAFWVPQDESPAREFAESPFRHRDSAHVRLAIPASRRFDLRARMVPPAVLRVIDADTGDDLEAFAVSVETGGFLDLLSFAGPFGGGLMHPPAGVPIRTLLRHAASPLTLSIGNDPNRSVREVLWVRAAGRCWHRVEVDHSIGGTHELRLARAGTLIVKSSGVPPPEGAILIVERLPDDVENYEEREVDALPWLDPTIGSRRPFSRFGARLESIPEGRYLVTLQLEGSRFAESFRLADCEVEIEPDGVAVANLAMEAHPAAPPSVALEVRIDVSPGWGDVDFVITLRPERVSALSRQDDVVLRRSQLLADGSRAGRWTLPELALAPGRYALEVEPFGVRRALVVTAGLPPLAIEIGAPVDVLVRFVDARTRTPLEIREPAWWLDEPADEKPWSGRRAGGTSSIGAEFRMRLPIGRIVFFPVVLEDYAGFGIPPVEIGPETREVTIALVHQTGVRVRIRSRTAALRAHGDGIDGLMQKVRMERRDGTGGPVSPSRFVGPVGGTGRGNERYVELIADPGDYRLTFPPTPGIAPLEARDVTVRDQEMTEVVVELRLDR